MELTWNPWHGCHKLSPGCAHCYVYRTDQEHGRDSTAVTKNKSFPLPVQRRRDGSWKVEPGTFVYTCFSSDFLVEEADPWRGEVWEMMRLRWDLEFLFITKRIHRLPDQLPGDWGEGYPNVHIWVTAENQDRADYRLPILRDIPARHKGIVCEPLLEPICLQPHLGPWIEGVIAGGESGPQARVCDYDWILNLRDQCREAGASFRFKQTGASFRKNGKVYHIPRRLQHQQAGKAAINLAPNLQ